MERNTSVYGLAQAPLYEVECRRDIPVPEYLQRVYWWTYIHPFAVWFFDRLWMVNLILLTQYNRMRRAVLKEFAAAEDGAVLQISSAYGNVIPKVAERVLAGGGSLDVIDVLPIQLEKLRHKLPVTDRIRLMQMNAAELFLPSSAYDTVMLFFLLHETPDPVRKKIMEEAFRVLRPGGKLIIADFSMPRRWNPFRYLWAVFLSIFEPFALDMWRKDIGEHLPPFARAYPRRQHRYFGDLFQKTVVTRPVA